MDGTTRGMMHGFKTCGEIHRLASSLCTLSPKADIPINIRALTSAYRNQRPDASESASILFFGEGLKDDVLFPI